MKTPRVDPESIDLDFLRQEFNRFRSEVSSMRDRVGGEASEALDHITAYLNGAGLSSRVATLEQEITQLTETLKGTGRQAVVNLERQVGSRPIASIAIAFGAGLVTSALLRRRG